MQAPRQHAEATCIRVEIGRTTRKNTQNVLQELTLWLEDVLQSGNSRNTRIRRKRVWMSEKQWYVPLSKFAGPISPLKRCTQNTKRRACKQRWPHAGSLEHKMILYTKCYWFLLFQQEKKRQKHTPEMKTVCLKGKQEQISEKKDEIKTKLLLGSLKRVKDRPGKSS